MYTHELNSEQMLLRKLLTIFVYLVVATISFSQSIYSVNENEGSVQPVIVLSNPSSTDVTVQVTDEEGTASG